MPMVVIDGREITNSAAWWRPSRAGSHYESQHSAAHSSVCIEIPVFGLDSRYAAALKLAKRLSSCTFRALCMTSPLELVTWYQPPWYVMATSKPSSTR